MLPSLFDRQSFFHKRQREMGRQVRAKPKLHPATRRQEERRVETEEGGALRRGQTRKERGEREQREAAAMANHLQRLGNVPLYPRA